MLNVLGVYERCSGQLINRNKTTIFFSKSTSEDRRTQIKEAHGLPSFMVRKKKANFEYIKEHVWRKPQGWEEKLLSQARREILIKAVVQPIPTYSISCFKLPLGLCNDLENLIRRFWDSEVTVEKFTR